MHGRRWDHAKSDAVSAAEDNSWGMATLKCRGEDTYRRQRRSGKQCPGSQGRRGF